MFSRTVLIVLAGALAFGAVTGSQAQVATPSGASLFADLGLPELTLTATDGGLELSHSEVPAGRYVVTLDNDSRNPTLVVDVVQLVQDDSAWCEDRLPPLCYAWYYQTYLPGGVSGESPQAILNLPAGEYGFWGPGELGEEPAAVLTVTGNPDASIDGPEPQDASVIVSTAEDGAGIALRLEGALRPGSQMVRLVNAAKQPIIIGAAQEPESSTDDEVASRPVFDASSGNVPPLDVYNDTEFGRRTFSVAQSPGTSQWVVLELMPGAVYVAGYYPDPLESNPWGWYAATAMVVPVEEREGSSEAS